MELLSFGIALGALSGIAYTRSRKEGDAFNFKILALLAIGAGTVACFGGRGSLATCVVLGCVATCAASDASCGYIYDDVTYPSIIGLLAISALAGKFNSALLWSVGTLALSSMLHVATRGRGLGLGDVKLFTVIAAGLCAGVSEVFAGAFILGACAAIVALIQRRLRVGETIAFAPYIALATIIIVPFQGLLP